MKFSKYYFLLTIILIAAGFFLTIHVFAQNTPSSPITSVDQIINLARKVLTWVATLFWIAAVAAVFYAAFLYLTAGGEEQNVEKAKKQLLYAVIAIAIGLIAYGVPAIVSNFLGSGGGATSGTNGNSSQPPALSQQFPTGHTCNFDTDCLSGNCDLVTHTCSV